MSNKMSNSLLKNSIWSVVGRFGYLIIVLITNIILARILEPEDFGKVAVVMFFITFSIIVTESGLSGALVRKNNASDLDISTIFIFNFFTSCLLALIIYIFSGVIAQYYNDSSLSDLLVFSILILVFNALGNIQMTLLIKEMEFKLKSILEIISVLCGSVVSVVLAVNNFGKVSIIWMYVINSIILTVLMWLVVGPLRTYKFSLKSFKEFYEFGINTTLTAAINAIFNSIYQLIFGKYFSMSVSGYYQQAKQLHDVPVNLLQSSIISVFYSALSKRQDDKNSFNIFYDLILSYYIVIVSLVSSFIFLYSDLVVSLILGEKWFIASIYLKFLIIGALFYCVEVFYKNILKVFNRTDLILKIEIIKKIFQVLTILVGFYSFNVLTFIYGLILTNIFGMILVCYYANSIRGVVEFGYIKSLIITSFMCLIFYYILDFFDSSYFGIVYYILYVFIYFCILKVFGLFDFFNVLKKIRTNMGGI